MWLGSTEYLYRNPALLEEVIDTAIEDNTFRADDLEFTFAARVSLLFPVFLPPYPTTKPQENIIVLLVVLGLELQSQPRSHGRLS